jgi:6-phosphogluconolactonase/glucosamine-6-phosphate isomerase/deaminase
MNMQWIHTTREQAVHDLGERLKNELEAGRSVLWLLSGGSNITAAVQIMQALPDDLTAELTVTLVDERYGPPGHADSNLTQLLQAGFEPKQAKLLPVLRDGWDFEATRSGYEEMLLGALANTDCAIALLGIGDDGHIAGILPQSIAVEVTKPAIVAYHSDPYDRLTPSFAVLKQMTASYTLAFGEGKKPMLTQLHDEDLTLDEQPAQILKQLGEAYVYNDQVQGETA